MPVHPDITIYSRGGYEGIALDRRWGYNALSIGKLRDGPPSQTGKEADTSIGFKKSYDALSGVYERRDNRGPQRLQPVIGIDTIRATSTDIVKPSSSGI